MKLRMSWLAVAGVVGSVSVAGAQTPPPPPPPASPPADTQPPATAPADPNAPVAPPVDPNAPPAPGKPAAPAPGAPVPPPALPGAPGTQPGVAPAEPPAALPPPPPPAAPPPAAAAPLPVVSPPAAPPATAPADTMAPATESKPKPLFFRGSTFTWNQAATTTMLGVGRDNIGHEHEVYAWLFSLKPNFYVLDLPKDKITVSTDISWQTELTNSDTTVDRNETVFNDLPINAGYKRTIFSSGGSQKGEYETHGSLTGGATFPTSKYSNSQGMYLRTSLGAGLAQKIKLLGSKADGLNHLTASFSLSWAHLFSRATTPTNPDLKRPRQNATGQTYDSDQLGGNAFAINRVGGKLAFALPLYKELALSTNFGFTGNFKPQFSTAHIHQVATEPDLTIESEGETYQPTTAFGVELSYTILDVVGLGVGYSNGGHQLGTDGKRRDMFYNADAQFYLDIVANIDAIYSKATGRDKKAAEKVGSRPGAISF